MLRREGKTQDLLGTITRRRDIKEEQVVTFLGGATSTPNSKTNRMLLAVYRIVLLVPSPAHSVSGTIEGDIFWRIGAKYRGRGAAREPFVKREFYSPDLGSRREPVERPGYSNQDKMSSSSQGTTMKVMKSPGTDCALTNCAYVSPSDLPSEVIQPGAIGLNAIHRRNVKVSANDSVTVVRFVPPERGFNLVLLTVELEFVKFRGKPEQLDAQILAKELQKRFAGQVLTVGQKVTFEYVGTNYTFCVNQTLLEGNSGNDDSTRGILTSETHFMFETPGNSGIKMLNQHGGSSTNLFKSKDFNFKKVK
ncbi:hypothetical protein MPTK1_6g00320 [Marchantia polymorpha subsp. ruderalis]|uniref:Vesicle-fusing ATPase n=1 Tax=Marchantia polymorpha subsp. ruderalis TaxID=1480154 RepID=A0AAF6BM06_MARPO|nr:hypothetical protein Mp_6g00320 [Marchantia polymorpha subsp. ruderalis]